MKPIHPLCQSALSAGTKQTEKVSHEFHCFSSYAEYIFVAIVTGTGSVAVEIGRKLVEGTANRRKEGRVAAARKRVGRNMIPITPMRDAVMRRSTDGRRYAGVVLGMGELTSLMDLELLVVLMKAIKRSAISTFCRIFLGSIIPPEQVWKAGNR